MCIFTIKAYLHIRAPCSVGVGVASFKGRMLISESCFVFSHTLVLMYYVALY